MVQYHKPLAHISSTTLLMPYLINEQEDMTGYDYRPWPSLTLCDPQGLWQGS